MKILRYIKSKPLWIIAIVLVIFLIGVIVVLIALTRSVTVPAEVTVTTGEVTDHNLETSVKVTLEGEKDFYSLSMTGPDGTEVGSAFITETQMADGNQSVWMPLVGNFESEVAAKPGAYSLVVTDTFGHNVYEKSFGPYSGADLSVIHISSMTTSNESYGGYYIDDIVLKVKNDGDLPAYVSGVDVEIDTVDGSGLSEEEEAILPGETATITASDFIAFGPFDEGDYSASFKLKEGFLGGGKTVATYTTIISIP